MEKKHPKRGSRSKRPRQSPPPTKQKQTLLSKDGTPFNPDTFDGDGGMDGPDDGGWVELPLDAYHELYDPQLTEIDDVPAPIAFAITNADYRGIVGKQSAKFRCALEVQIFAEGWTQVPLFGDSFAISEIDLGETDALTLVSDYRHHLLAKRPGRYRIELTVFTGFLATSGKSGVGFSIPRAARTAVELAIPRLDVDVTARPSLDVEIREIETPSDGDALDQPHTVFRAILPPTDHLQIEWTQAVDEPDAETAPVKPLLTAEVHTLASVGEGVVVCQSQVSYDVIQGQVGRFTFKLPADVNVLSVTSPAAKTWRVRDAEALKITPPTAAEGPVSSGESAEAEAALRVAPGAHPINEGEGLQLGSEDVLLEVNLSYEIASAHEINLVYERKMQETSGRVKVPVLQVVGVERQRGFVGVEARTNVEVTVVDQEAAARVDIQELPRDLWNVAQNPLLFGFKYLRAPYVVELEIKKHLDVEVLVATIDSAHIEATMVADGKLETKCLYFVRNNQQQYLRLALPPESTVWSTFVSNRPVKPARDAASNDVLISLEKSQMDADLQRAFPVEIVYLTKIPVMNDDGDVRFSCPKVDVPINLLMLRLNLPKGYVYQRFGGTMKKTRAFSRNFLTEAPPQPDAPRSARRMAETQMLTNIMQQPQQQQNVMIEQAQEFALDDAMMDMPQQQIPSMRAPMKSANLFSGLGGSGRGILPVKMEVPTIGEQFQFEQLIVLSEFATITAKFRRPRRWGLFAVRD